MRAISVLLLFIAGAFAISAQPRTSLVQEVRLKLSAGDFDSAEAMVDEDRRAKGKVLVQTGRDRG